MNVKKLIHRLTKTEKILIVFLGLILIGSLYQVADAFYEQNSEFQSVPGGVYVEASVGRVDNLNPLFIQQGTIAQDISQLIFSGLTKFDTQTGEIVGDLANVKVSSNGKEYTFVIKEGAKWHDGTDVTAADILFTYNDIIKNPEFKGDILNYNDYTGIKVTKIDDRTIQFLLEKPDSFFLVKTMVGILPKHLLENEPVAFLKTAPFNFNPVGSGRYKFVSQVNLPDHTEYGLEAFEDFYDGKPNIDNILFKVFNTYDELKKKMSGLSGIRNVPADMTEEILKKDRFVLDRYQLPQYVAIFMNSESPKLKNNIVRLALQLGTDKAAMASALGDYTTIDTPLLEIDQENWIHQHSVKKANGALFETQWQIPNKEEVMPEDTPQDDETDDSEAEEVDPTEEVTYINSPNEGKNLTTSREPITITGTAPKGTKSIWIDDYELTKYVPGDPGWSYVAAFKYDSLEEGENIYKVYATDSNDEKTLIDSIKITFGDSETVSEGEREKLAEENAEAVELPIREDEDGEKLILRLVTTSKPEVYGQVARLVKEQWKKIGVGVNIEILENGEFQQAMSTRDYDLLIFGQNLGYNLDAYPYWHSSQAKEGGLNLSQFKNFVVDSLLEKARLEDGEERHKTLNDIQEIIAQEAPAIFLYTPTYYSAIAKTIKHPEFQHLATTSDRLANIENWFAKVDMRFKKGVTPLTFISWIIKQF
jgi:ABC-type transport system substrate-binding protein